MLTEETLVNIHRSIKQLFGDNIAQTVAVKLLEKAAKGYKVESWRDYAYITAKHTLIDTCRYNKRLASSARNLSLTEVAIETSLEDQVIAREDCRRIAKNKNAIKVVRYSLYGDRTYSKQYIEQIRRQLREELK